MAIRAVLFDLDGTLLDRDGAVRRFAADQFHRDVAAGSADQAAYVERFVALDQNGYASKHDVFRSLIAEYRLAPADVDQQVAQFWRRFPDYTEAYPGAEDLLATLRVHGLALGLVTNGTEASQARKIEALRLAPAFDAILISEVEGVDKPDPVLFRRALRQLHVTADEAVFVGDHPVNDIEGARAVGLRTIWRPSRWWEAPRSADAVAPTLDAVWPAIQTMASVKA